MKTGKFICSVAISVALLALAVPSVRADALAVVDVTPQLQTAGLDIRQLRAIEVGGVVVLRGTTNNPVEAQRAGAVLQTLGYKRVANLIEIMTAPDDAAIRREAERKLAMNSALDGCRLRVNSKNGVLTIGGQIHSALQRDVAIDLVHNIDGVSAVKADLRTR